LKVGQAQADEPANDYNRGRQPVLPRVTGLATQIHAIPEPRGAM
jgi:hypothetical protein